MRVRNLIMRKKKFMSTVQFEGSLQSSHWVLAVRKLEWLEQMML